MGKKRVQSRQVRQVRQVKPKSIPAPAAAGGDQRKQRERYVQSGGMLQGYSPELVVRIGYIGAAVAVGCLAGMALLLPLPPYGWPGPVAASLVWLVPIALGGSFILPGYRLCPEGPKG